MRTHLRALSVALLSAIALAPLAVAQQPTPPGATKKADLPLKPARDAPDKIH